MDLLYKKIIESIPVITTTCLANDPKYYNIHDFIKENCVYTSDELSNFEYRLIVSYPRTPEIESILCLFQLRDQNYKVHSDLLVDFIDKNKHYLIKMLKNSDRFFDYSSIIRFYLIFDGDKYLLEKAKNIRCLTKRIGADDYYEWNYLQMYCQANYGSFHTHNDWDIDFTYSEHSSCQ